MTLVKELSNTQRKMRDEFKAIKPDNKMNPKDFGVMGNHQSEGMVWPEGVSEEAREVTERFFADGIEHEYKSAFMLAFAYGYIEYEDRQRREAVLRKFTDAVARLNVER